MIDAHITGQEAVIEIAGDADEIITDAAAIAAAAARACADRYARGQETKIRYRSREQAEWFCLVRIHAAAEEKLGIVVPGFSGRIDER